MTCQRRHSWSFFFFFRHKISVILQQLEANFSFAICSVSTLPLLFLIFRHIVACLYTQCTMTEHCVDVYVGNQLCVMTEIIPLGLKYAGEGGQMVYSSEAL